MEDLKEYIEDRFKQLAKNLGFTPQTPQKETKEPTTISGTITFLGKGTLAKAKQNQQDSQQKNQEESES